VNRAKRAHEHQGQVSGWGFSYPERTGRTRHKGVGKGLLKIEKKNLGKKSSWMENGEMTRHGNFRGARVDEDNNEGKKT